MPLSIAVDRLEFAVLADQTGVGRVPIVATFSHYSQPVTDVRRAFVDAEQRCRQRGLLDHNGQAGDEVRELLGIYPQTSVEFDLRFSTEKEHELRAAVSRSGRNAVRTVVEGDTIHVEEVRPENAVASLVSVLPDQAPARIHPLSIDATALREVLAKHPDPTPDVIEAGLRAHGVDTREYRKISQLLDGPRTGAGQLGVTAWGRGRREQRGEQTVQVIDIPSGRVAVYDSSSRRMVVGADVGTFNRVLGEIAEETARATER